MVAVMEGGTDLTLVATIIGSCVTVIVALATFGVFFLRRIETLIRDTKTELRSEIQGVQSEIQGVRTETRTEFASVRSEVQGVRAEMGTEFASVRSEVQGVRAEMGTEFASVRSEIQGVRTDLGHRVDGVNSRVDQVFLAVSGLASEQAAASNPADRAEKRPPAA